MGPSTNQVVLWVRFPVGAGSSHVKDFKNGSGPSLHGTQDEAGTTKHNCLPTKDVKNGSGPCLHGTCMVLAWYSR